MWLSLALFAHVSPISSDPLPPCEVIHKPVADNKPHAALNSDSMCVKLSVHLSIWQGQHRSHDTTKETTDILIGTTVAALHIMMLFTWGWLPPSAWRESLSLAAGSHAAFFRDLLRTCPRWLMNFLDFYVWKNILSYSGNIIEQAQACAGAAGWLGCQQGRTKNYWTDFHQT